MNPGLLLTRFRSECVVIPCQASRKGHELAISWDEDDGMRLTVDGLPAGYRPTLGRLEFELPSSKA